MGIAKAAIAAPGHADPLADFGEVGHQGLAVFRQNLGAHRYFENDILALGAMAVAAHAVHAPGGLEMLAVAVINQRVETIGGLNIDAAAATAIAAIGAAKLDIFLAPERDAAGAALAGAHIYLGFIEKFHRSVRRLGNRVENKRGAVFPAPLVVEYVVSPGWSCRPAADASRLPLFRGLRRDDRHERAITGPGAELYLARDLGKDGVILAHADIVAGVPFGAALAQDDIAGDDGFATEFFHAQAPARRIAAVT